MGSDSKGVDKAQVSIDLLQDDVLERVIMEATCDYWRPFFYLLEAGGITVRLVNARDVKNVPGRPKTDKLDAVWLAKLNERGMVRPSFVRPAQIRQLRDYTRMRSDLIGDRARQIQRLEKLLEDALIKLSAVATNIMGVSGRAILQAMIDGQHDPVILAEIGLSMAVFPTPGHLVSWAKLAPRTIQSGAMRRKGRTGHGNRHTNTGRRTRNHVQQLKTLGHTVTLTPADA